MFDNIKISKSDRIELKFKDGKLCLIPSKDTMVLDKKEGKVRVSSCYYKLSEIEYIKYQGRILFSSPSEVYKRMMAEMAKKKEVCTKYSLDKKKSLWQKICKICMGGK